MFLLYGGLFFLLFGRMLFIQITGQAEGRVLASMAEAKYAREAVLKADRGDILDRNGEVIASDTLSYRLIAVISDKASEGSKTPRHIVDKEKTAEVLANYLPLEEDEIFRRLTEVKESTYQVEFGKFGRDINHETVEAIRKEKLPGILFVEDKKRFYPNGVFASYLIGFASRVEDADKNVETMGQMGLEATFNKELTGIDGKVNFQSDRWGFVLPKSEKKIEPAQDGFNIRLTIDKTIQNFVEDAMNRVEQEYAPKRMMVVVADPKTGEILAMSQRPTFHPMTREGLTENWLNEAVELTIEPGSTMKMFTVAAAIEEGKWNPNDFYKSGQYKLFNDTVRDHNLKGWGYISFLEGFQRSSNVSIAYLLERVGDKTFIEYMDRFGFGQRTGIDLPNEANGRILDQYPLERLTTAFGQGSTVTPIQMIQAATAIANDGKMMKPYVIDQILDPNEEKVIRDEQPEERGTPISPITAKKVRELLASTVTAEHGTGRKFALDGYTVGGKTGTAEIPRPNGRGYLSGHGNYLYSFIGMAPIEDPQLITYVFVQQPKIKANEIGSDPVSKVFKPIMESSLKYLNVQPIEHEPIETTTLQSVVDKKVVDAVTTIESQGFIPIMIGEEGVVTAQYPTAGTKLGDDSIVLIRAEGPVHVPDFTGWSKKMMLTFEMLSGLDIRITGDGYVKEQSISAGSIVSPTEPIVIQLEKPESLFQPKPDEDDEKIRGG